MSTCSLFGHRVVFNYDVVRKRLIEKIIYLVDLGVDKFLVGRHGEFDRLALEVLRWVDKNYIKIKFDIVFSGPTLFGSRMQKDYIAQYYKDVSTVCYPVEELHFKQQITATNQMMIDDSDVVLCYYDQTRQSVGVKNAIRYANKQNKKIVNLFTDDEYLIEADMRREEFDEFISNIRANKGR